MKTTTLLFDLDGTLLPMDQDKFAGAYLKGLVSTAIPFGYEKDLIFNAIVSGTFSMVSNSGGKTNEEVFWDCLTEKCGDRIKEDMHIFDEFYENDFDKIKAVTSPTDESKKIIELVKGYGTRAVLATNPLFPRVATKKRIAWAGLDYNDFELVTTYEDSHYCKPNIKYYEEILSKLNVSPENCIMVGNDVAEDMIASQLGMKVFLLTDCLINKANENIDKYPHGGFTELTSFLNSSLKC